jgi:hypothetical protein
MVSTFSGLLFLPIQEGFEEGRKKKRSKKR